MKLYEILAQKGNHVLSIEPDATLADMVERLVANNCGSLVVLSAGEMVGIITERDTLRSYVATKQPLEQLFVRDFMTKEVVTGRPEDDVGDTMGLLTRRRIRHLPVLEDGKLVGMISIGDVVKALHDQLSVENHFMKNYIMS